MQIIVCSYTCVQMKHTIMVLYRFAGSYGINSCEIMITQLDCMFHLLISLIISFTIFYLCHYQGGAAKDLNNTDGASSSTTTSSTSASSSNTLVVTASANTTTNSSSSHSRVSPGSGGGGHQHHRQSRHSNTTAHTSHVYNRDKGHRDHGNKSKTKSTNKANLGSYIFCEDLLENKTYYKIPF